MDIQKKRFKIAVLLILGMCAAAFSVPAAAFGITLSWERPGSERITGYHIYYGPVGTNYRYEPEVIIDSPDQTQCQINDLESGVTYEFTATSIDSTNNRESDFSPAISYTVPEVYSSAAGVEGEDAVTNDARTTNGASDSAIVGAWDILYSDPDVEYGCLVFYENGQYLVYDSYLEGVEYGTYTHDNSTGELNLNVVKDENGDRGLADNGIPMADTIYVDGDTLTIIAYDGDTDTIPRVCNENAPIVGAWDHFPNEYGACVFYENGKYVVYDSSEVEGVEYGTYTHDNSTGSFSVYVVKDENWAAGFAADGVSFGDGHIVIENDNMYVNDNPGAPRVGTCDSGGGSDGNDSVFRPEYIEKVQKVYIAYYLRPADPEGLGYWVARLGNNNGDMTCLIEAFANSEESRRLWGKIDSASIGDVIEEVYWRLFDRPADAPGKSYYVNGFNEGRFTPGAIVLDMLNGARSEDAKAIENKVAYADLFVSVLDPDGDCRGPFEATYDEQAARDLLTDIISESANITKDRVLRDVLDYIAEPEDPLFYD